MLERRNLEHGEGHIEPWRRLKGGSAQPLIDRTRDRRLLFLDESGRALDAHDPYVALAGIAITAESGYLADSARTPLVTIVGLAIGFGAASVLLWVTFRFLRAPAAKR